MTALAEVHKKDALDIVIGYINEKPREFFKSIHQMLFWNKYMTASELVGVKNGLASFLKVFNAFSLLDLTNSLNDVRNYFSGKNVCDAKVLLSDTLGNIADATMWLTDTAKIAAISTGALNGLMALSGGMLMISSLLNGTKDVAALANMKEDEKGNVLKIINVAKDTFLFMIGAIWFNTGWFIAPLFATALTVCGLGMLISNFTSYLIEKDHISVKA